MLAVSTTALRRGAAIGAGHEVASHAAASDLTHVASGRDRASTLMILPLLAVAPCNVDHGGSVNRSTGHGTYANAHRSASHRR